MTEDELRVNAQGRVFVPIGNMDHYDVRQKNFQANQTVGCYTIGVLTDVSPVQTSKKGTKFCIMKLSDLNKYDLNKVKPTYTTQLEKIEASKREAEIKALLKAFTPGGYKQVHLMVFGESALEVSKIKCGCVLQILNPMLMTARREEYGHSFSINSEAQYNLVGYSNDYDICTGMQMAIASGERFRCRAFLNKSVETICDRHKMEQKQEQVKKIHASRPNMMSDRVDVNAIKKVQKLEDAENKVGAFGGNRQLNKNNKQPFKMQTQAQKTEKDKVKQL